MAGGPARIAIATAGLVPLAAVVLGSTSPAGDKLTVLLLAVATLAAMHGYGRLLAAWAGDGDAPLGLTLAWGVAAYLGLAGALVALGVFGPAARMALLAAGTVLGTAWLWANAERIARARRAPRVTTVLAIACAAIVIAVVVLAAAGRWSGPFTDGDTNYLGQLRRLDDTGGLADGFGFPRALGLGGQVVLASLAAPLDPRAGYLVDRGILFAVVVLLAMAVVHRRPRAVVAVAACVPIAMTAVSEYVIGMAPFGSLVVLVVAAALTVERAVERGSPRSMLLAVLVAAAAATVAHAAAVFAAATIAAGSWLISRWARDGRRWRGQATLVTLAVVAPYVVAAVRARVDSPRPHVHHGSAAALAVGGGIALVLGLLAALSTRGRPIQLVLIAASASVALAGAIAPSASGVVQYALPVATAVVLAIALLALVEPAWLEPATDAGPRVPAGATVIAVTAAIGLFAAARFQSGGGLVGWRVRAVQLVDDARAVGALPPAPATRLAAAYAAAQRSIPPDAPLAIWVERPDLIRYDRNPVIDLRSGARRRAALPRTGLAYVLVDEAAAGDDWRPLVAVSEPTYRADGLLVLAVDRGAASR